VIYLLYGQPGTGKSTLAVGMALEYLAEHRRVAANFAIDPSPACQTVWGKLLDRSVTVLPSRPTFDQLRSLGVGWSEKAEFGREDRAGLLVIDEAGPWLSSRTWNDKERAAIIDWFLQSRKRGWDVVVIAQAPALVDKQVREAVIEGYGRCRRLDRIRVPFTRISLPRVHVCVMRYGLDAHAVKLFTKAYRGATEHQCFASYALFEAEADIAGPYSTLPPRLVKFGRGDHWSEKLRDQIKRLRQWTPGKVAPRGRPSGRPKLPHVMAAMSLPPEARLRVLRAVEAPGAAV